MFFITHALLKFRKRRRSTAIKSAMSTQNWSLLLDLLHDKKTAFQCASETTGATLLHRICCFDPPLNVVQALHERAPLMVTSGDIFHRLPIHEACRYNASREVVEFLLSQYRDGIYSTDQHGRTPLHYAVDQTGFGYQALPVDVIVSLAVAAPGLLNQRDGRQKTPMDLLKAHKTGREVRSLIKLLSPMATMYRSMSLQANLSNESPDTVIIVPNTRTFDSALSSSNNTHKHANTSNNVKKPTINDLSPLDMHYTRPSPCPTSPTTTQMFGSDRRPVFTSLTPPGLASLSLSPRLPSRTASTLASFGGKRLFSLSPSSAASNDSASIFSKNSSRSAKGQDRTSIPGDIFT